MSKLKEEKMLQLEVLKYTLIYTVFSGMNSVWVVWEEFNERNSVWEESRV